KIGVSFMPMLDEGTTLDMPVTVPRAGVTQVADDLKARDALLRGFPEVESVVGKSGRAETATDPAPLDMVETFVNFRPRDLWPRRVLRYSDAMVQTRRVLKALERRDYLSAADDRDSFVNDVTQKALERFAAQSVRVVLGKYYEPEVFPPFGDLRAELDKAFRDKVLFRARTGGPKGDLVDDEMGRVLQVPGWSNIFTQPIVNRIEMLSS